MTPRKVADLEQKFNDMVTKKLTSHREMAMRTLILQLEKSVFEQPELGPIIQDYRTRLQTLIDLRCGNSALPLEDQLANEEEQLIEEELISEDIQKDKELDAPSNTGTDESAIKSNQDEMKSGPESIARETPLLQTVAAEPINSAVGQSLTEIKPNVHIDAPVSDNQDDAQRHKKRKRKKSSRKKKELVQEIAAEHSEISPAELSYLLDEALEGTFDR
jgi:hypothetical protein